MILLMSNYFTIFLRENIKIGSNEPIFEKKKIITFYLEESNKSLINGITTFSWKYSQAFGFSMLSKTSEGT